MHGRVIPVMGMVLKGYPRISETFISNEIQLLEAHGFTIHIFSMRLPREAFTHASVKRIKARVDYLPSELWSDLHRLLPPNLLLAARMPVRYLRTLRIALRRFLRTRKSATFKHLLQAGYLVQRLLPHSGVGHLHAHFAHSPTSVTMFAAHLSGLPFSFTAHAKDIYTSNAAQLREKISMARFVITCTEYNRRYLQKLISDLSLLPSSNPFTPAGGEFRQRGITPIHRVYHGIDVRRFDSKQQWATVDGAHEIESALDASHTIADGHTQPYRLLTIARIITKKGLPTIYRALVYLRNQQVAFHHVLIGDGEERKTLLALISQLGLNQETEWLGTQPHHVVRTHFRQADAFVLGCRIAPDGDRDGIPNVIAESMAMGVPVVATHLSAIPELIEDGRTGLLVPPEQPAEMARALIRLRENHALRQSIITNARKRVRRIFDNQVLVRELAAIYRRELAS